MVRKSLISVFLIACLALPFAGSYLVLRHHIRQVKREVRYQIATNVDKEELILIKDSKSNPNAEIQWKRHDEFKYIGRMYDIMFTEFKGDTIFYRCWPDDKETELNIRLRNVLSFNLDRDDQNNANRKNIKDLYKKQYFGNDRAELQIPSTIDVDNITSLQFIYSSKIVPPLTPPPELV